jgi:hypothetical protein
MPYWGANVKNSEFVVQAKIHGPTGGADAQPATEELKEYLKNLINYKNIAENSLAVFFAEKIATAYKDHPSALWVTVDILTAEGGSFGDVRLIGATSE